MFKIAKINVRNILAVAKSQYYNNKIKACGGNQRTVFGVVNKVLHLNQTVLPKFTKSNKDMAQDFNKFFNKKILNIHNGFDSTDRPLGMESGEVPCTSVLEAFSPLTENEVGEL